MATTLDTNASILIHNFEILISINNFISRLKKGLSSLLVIPLAIILFILLLALSPVLYIVSLYIIYKANRGINNFVSNIPKLPTSELIELQNIFSAFDELDITELEKPKNKKTLILEIVLKPFESLFISLFLKGKELKKIIDNQVSEDLLLFEQSMSENTFIGE